MNSMSYNALFEVLSVPFLVFVARIFLFVACAALIEDDIGECASVDASCWAAGTISE